MSALLDAMALRRDAAVAEMVEIAAAADRSGKNWDPEVIGKLETLEGEIKSLDERASAIQDRWDREDNTQARHEVRGNTFGNVRNPLVFNDEDMRRWTDAIEKRSAITLTQTGTGVGAVVAAVNALAPLHARIGVPDGTDQFNFNALSIGVPVATGGVGEGTSLPSGPSFTHITGANASYGATDTISTEALQGLALGPQNYAAVLAGGYQSQASRSLNLALITALSAAAGTAVTGSSNAAAIALGVGTVADNVSVDVSGIALILSLGDYAKLFSSATPSAADANANSIVQYGGARVFVTSATPTGTAYAVSPQGHRYNESAPFTLSAVWSPDVRRVTVGGSLTASYAANVIGGSVSKITLS